MMFVIYISKNDISLLLKHSNALVKLVALYAARGSSGLK